MANSTNNATVLRSIFFFGRLEEVLCMFIFPTYQIFRHMANEYGYQWMVLAAISVP